MEYAGWMFSYDARVEMKHAGKLKSEELVRRTMTDVAELVDMASDVGPQFSYGRGEQVLSAVMAGPESHMTFHARPEEGRFSLDVFVPEKFDSRMISEFLKNRLFVKLRSSHWLPRVWP